MCVFVFHRVLCVCISDHCASLYLCVLVCVLNILSRVNSFLCVFLSDKHVFFR